MGGNRALDCEVNSKVLSTGIASAVQDALGWVFALKLKNGKTFARRCGDSLKRWPPPSDDGSTKVPAITTKSRASYAGESSTMRSARKVVPARRRNCE